MEEAEVDPESIGRYIYSYPVQKPNYYNLQLSPEATDIALSSGVDEVVNSILSIITLSGIETLYNHTDWMILNESQQYLVLQYTRSYGYNYKIVIEDLNQEGMKKIKIVFQHI
jgi:hypothetical protein